MATIGTILNTLLFGKFVGKDEFGNKYYEHRSALLGGRKKRWVIYNGEEEATKIPATWHAWVHYVTDKKPKSSPGPSKDKTKTWIKPHLPNLSGTKYTYRPKGHVLEGGERATATGDYEAWKPE